MDYRCKIPAWKKTLNGLPMLNSNERIKSVRYYLCSKISSQFYKVMFVFIITSTLNTF